MNDIGALVLIKTSYTDQSGWKLRPGVVVGEHLNDYQIGFISKKVDKYISESTSIVVDNEDLDSGRLKTKSIIRCHKTFWTEKRLCKKVGSLKKDVAEKILRLKIKYIIDNHYQLAHKPYPFIPGQSTVPVSGRVYGPEEMQSLVESALDFWLTTGRFNEAFEKKLAEYLGIKHVMTTNSGSSANLLAVSALTSPKLGERALKPGDEVITLAAAFPTTVNPIIQNGLVPVFVDIDIPAYNIKPDLIEAAVSEKTRAIMLAHTLGNPFNVNEVLSVAKRYNLWVIEDCCDALGSTYTIIEPDSNKDLSAMRCEQSAKKCGTFGHISTFSFYPAHHITMGEGGAVVTNDDLLKRLIESFRDWGRDCWCAPGHDNTCGKRFGWQLGDLPKGYDHKYIYSHAGYNLKITDMQAAVGLAQMDRLEEFIQIRKRNFTLLMEGFKKFSDIFILPEPTPNSDPSWFGFPLTIKDGSVIKREKLLKFLNDHRIGTRLLFSGNITRQPYFKEKSFRISGILENTDKIMNDTFWVGVYPGTDKSSIEFLLNTINYFIHQ